MVRANTIKPSDIIGDRIYVLADGTEQKHPRFLLRKLKVGNRILQNVTASVGSPKGDLLLGQSFLSHFDSWTLDNKRHILALVGKPAGTGDEASPEDQTNSASIAGPVPSRIPGDTPSVQSTEICGKPVEYAIEQSGKSTGFLGVWTGNWNNASLLCSGLIVDKVYPTGVADVIYIYGPSRPGGGFSWKRQQRAGTISDGVLSFKDEQGSTFSFYLDDPDTLDARFSGESGQLKGMFQKLH